MKENVYFGHIGIGEPVKGEALVADDNFSARYDLDRINGIFLENPTNFLIKVT